MPKQLLDEGSLLKSFEFLNNYSEIDLSITLIRGDRLVHLVDLPGGHAHSSNSILELNEVGLSPPSEELCDAPNSAGPKNDPQFVKD